MMFLHILPLLFLLVQAGNLEEIPCQEEEMKTTEMPLNPCGKVWGLPFKRKNGYWCSNMFVLEMKSTGVFSYDEAQINCNYAGMVLSSLETEEEYKYYKNRALKIGYNLTAWWVGVGYNPSTKQYFWNDGQAIPTIDPQPKDQLPDGKGAWFVNQDPNVEEYGVLKIVNKTGKGSPGVNGIICGAPGVQFN